MFALRRVVIVVIVARTFVPPALATEKKAVVALSLQEYAALALKNSLSIKDIEASLATGRFSWLSSRRGLTWPTLTASGSINQTQISDAISTHTDDKSNQGKLALSQPFLTGTQLSLDSTWSRSTSRTNYRGTLSDSLTQISPVYNANLSQPMYLFTGNESWRSKREADIGWANNEDSYWKSRLDLENNARSQYYQLLLQIEKTAVEQKKLESSKLVINYTRAQVRVGKLAEVELVRADIRARTDERNIQNTQTNLEQAMNSAKDLVSLPAETELRLTSKLSYEPFRIPLEKLKEAALEHNHDLRIAKRGVETSEISYLRTREADHPKLTASGGYQLTRNRSEGDNPLDPWSWNVGLNVDWSVFNASKSQLAKRQAEISLENTKRAYDKQRRQLVVDVQNAYLDIKRTEEQIVDFGPQREAAERNLRAIRLQYQNGLTRLTDVFDAENQMRDLDLEFLNLLVSFNIARDKVVSLVGVHLDELSAVRKP